MNNIKAVSMLVFFCILTNLSFSQQNPPRLGSWTMLTGQFRLNEKWGIGTDIQFREHGVASEVEQLLFRGGINYHYRPKVSLTAGYAYVSNHRFDGEFLETPASSENRTWQQLLLKNTVGRFNFDHRYRLEQRWIKSNNATQYLDRIRYQIRLTVPLTKKEVSKNTLFLSAYDEVFVHFSSNPFDRNRLYGALGYQLSPVTNLQLGYMAQTVGTATKHLLQAGLNLNVDLRVKD